jgi:glycosyltransferase involved in cell wall biosynthesis
MASGVPVVASDLPGTREVVRDSGSGYLEAPEQIAAMANRVVELLMDPKKAGLMGQKGVRAVESLDVQGTLEQYESLYQGLWDMTVPAARRH